MVRQSQTEVHGSAQAEAALNQLCHHLSLSKNGKVQGAVDSLVLTVLAFDPDVGRGDANEVAVALSTYFSIELPVGEVRKAIETHLRAGRLQNSVTGSGLVLSASARAAYEARVEEASKLEDAVRREWLLEVTAAYPDLDAMALWSSLRTYLGAVFRRNGALAVELLRPGTEASGGAANDLRPMLRAALDQHGLKDAPGAADAVNLFFLSSTPARARYVSQLLDGTFTFFALSVSDATADFLRGQLPSTRLFLDTNVVLGLLELHDNPLAEATLELVNFIKKHKLPYKLYFHERTLKELNDLVENARIRLLTGPRITSNVSRAVTLLTDRTMRLTGIERRYHALNAEQPLDPQVFLSKFEHIEELLSDKGVALYRESGPDFDVQTKGEYIAEFEHFVSKQARKQRPYLARDHDVMLWMSLQRQRRRARSALKAGALLLTNDYVLFTFDSKFLRHQAQGHLSTVVLPQQLLQVLRPLVGTTADFDGRFAEVFAAPEFRTAQSDYDETASMVVSYLATYKDVSTETAVRVLSDEVLLSQLRPDDQTESEFRALIESALVRDNEQLLADFQAEHERAETAEAARRQHEGEAATAASRAADAQREVERLAVEQDRVAAAADERAKAEAAHVKELEAELKRERARATSAMEERDSERTARTRLASRVRLAVAVVLAVVGVLTIAFGPDLLGWHAAAKHDNRLQISFLCGVAWAGCCYIVVRPRHWPIVLPGVVVAAGIGAITLS